MQFVYDESLLQRIAVEEEIEVATAGQLLQQAHRRGYHDQLRRDANQFDGPHNWYPVPASIREEEARDDRRAKRAELREMMAEIIDYFAEPDSGVARYEYGVTDGIVQDERGAFQIGPPRPTNWRDDWV